MYTFRVREKFTNQSVAGQRRDREGAAIKEGNTLESFR